MQNYDDLSGVTEHRTTCWGGPGCDAAGCGIKIFVKDGKVIRVEGDSDCADNQGHTCPRILMLTKYIYHPDRLKHPLKRVGKRGEGKFEPISWDEAYDTIAREFGKIKEKYGGEAVWFGQGTGRDIMCWISRLAYSFGSPNWSQIALRGSACYIPKLAGSLASFGGMMECDCSQYLEKRYDDPRWEPPKYIIVWGKNPVYSHPDGFHGYWLIEAMKRGSKLITVDPRFTWLASKSDYFLQIRPGTDGALALSMLHVIIEEDLYDHEFVEKWTYGFDQLKDHVKEWTPEKAEVITWVPADLIRETARAYAREKPSSIMMGVGIDHSVGGVETSMAINCLMALTGNVDVPGGNAIIQAPFGHFLSWTGGWGWFDLLTEEQRQKKTGLKEYPMTGMGFLFSQNEIGIDCAMLDKPYPIRGLWLQTTNTIATPSYDPKLWVDVMNKMDFIVDVDLFMTQTGMYADIILPATSVAEKDSIHCTWTTLSAIPRAIPPIEDTRSDQQIVLEMGKRWNPDAWPWDNVEQMLDTVLEGAGLKFADLVKKGYMYPKFEYKKYEQGFLREDAELGFESPTGKFELYSKGMEDMGYNPLPEYIEPVEGPLSTPELYREYPLVLTSGGRSPVYTHAEFRDIPWMREIHPDPVLDIHPDTAKKYGITDGEWVWIETKRGRAMHRAKFTLGMDPRVVHGQHGWWYPEELKPGVDIMGHINRMNINNTVSASATGVTGFGAPYKSSLCKVYPTREEVA